MSSIPATAITTPAVTFENPPARDIDTMPSRQEIAAALADRPGDWAIVARVDRMPRAIAMSDRIREGREYGAGYAAVVRKIGAEIRVYARYTGKGA